ncbi:hypothetical protein SABIM44S_03598 [Streptomyces abikoensis]
MQPADLDAVPAGQHQVEQHEIGLHLTKSSKCLVAVRNERRLETLTTQHNAEHLGQCGVVVDDKDASLHIDIIPFSHPVHRAG